jgi:hypothetical protein
MDGALPPEEARFLERRLQHDAELRAKWERMQLASSCLRGHDLRPMPEIAGRVAHALEQSDEPARSARPWLGWAIAASLAALAIVMVPRLQTPEAAPEIATAPVESAPVESVPSPEPEMTAPTPGAADLVAERAPDPAPSARSPDAAAMTVAASTPETATEALSPTEFPLAERSTSWPRAGLPGADPAMEGYLVRHNEMANADALGGFVPYLDVVTAEQPEAAAAAPSAESAPATDDTDGTR